MNFKRYLIGISYEGKNFYGFQEQKGQNVKTVEGVLKSILKDFLHEKNSWINMSRTDKGVNARINYVVANFKRELDKKEIDLIKKRAKEEGIEIKVLERVPLNFTLRGISKAKTYKYFLPKSGEVWVFDTKRNVKLNFEELKINYDKFKYIKELLENKEVEVINISKYDKTKNYQYKTKFLKLEMKDTGDKIEFTIVGDKFYWEEIRRLINVIISYLSSYLSEEDLKKIFSKDKMEFKAKAYPPENLYLWDVEFDI